MRIIVRVFAELFTLECGQVQFVDFLLRVAFFRLRVPDCKSSSIGTFCLGRCIEQTRSMLCGGAVLRASGGGARYSGPIPLIAATKAQ
jgi:hypothetical protein